MELERVEAICGLESSSRSRLWGTRGDRAGTQEVAVFGLGLSRNTGVAYVGELRTSSTKGVQFLQDLRSISRTVHTVGLMALCTLITGNASAAGRSGPSGLGRHC